MRKAYNEMTDFERRMTICIEEWAELTETDEFLDYAEGLDLSGMAIENGERVVYFANGLYNLADAYRMGENDGENEKKIIETLAECGFDFEENTRK